MYEKVKLTMVVPTIARDVSKLLNNVEYFFEYLPIDNICIVSTEEVGRMLPNDNRLRYISESLMVDFEKIKKIITYKSGKEAAMRTGWYVQQFIKMSFCRFTDSDYYFLWDSDTVPVKSIKLFDDNGIPFLDYKTEYHQPYFETIQLLLPGYNKKFKGSFISEHMLINSAYMRELLCKIESNIGIPGTSFDEKIINAIPENHVGGSGFSEFETYGTYIYKEHINHYALRKWHSMRYGGFFFQGRSSLSFKELSWLSLSYDAITFEKGDKLTWFSTIVRNEYYRRFFKASSLEVLSFLIRVKRRLLGLLIDVGRL